MSNQREIPKSYDHRAAEKAWRERWDAWGIYRFDLTRPREESFIVDSPPPTVSGSLHVGHGYSYAHQDLIVRYQRMRGRNVALSDGVGRQRSAHRAAGAERVRHPAQSRRCRTTRAGSPGATSRPASSPRKCRA